MPRMRPSSTAPSHSTTSTTQSPSPHTSSTNANSTSPPKTSKTSTSTSSRKRGRTVDLTNTATKSAPSDGAPASADGSHPTSATASPTGSAPTNRTTATNPDPPSNPWVYDLTTLTPRLLGIVTEIEAPITWFGHSEKEVATRLGVQTSVVRRCRNELRDAVRGGGQNTHDAS
jgi:hypothetical protein